MVLFILLFALAAVAIVATVLTVVRDGYRHVPTRRALSCPAHAEIPAHSVR